MLNKNNTSILKDLGIFLGGVIVIIVLTVIAMIGVGYIKITSTAKVWTILAMIMALAIMVTIFFIVRDNIRNELLKEIKTDLGITAPEAYDDRVIVKSRHTLENYTDIKYFKDNGNFSEVLYDVKTRCATAQHIRDFLEKNNYQTRYGYDVAEKYLLRCADRLSEYIVDIVYVTSAGNIKDSIKMIITDSRIKEIEKHPEWLMSKGEYDKILKQRDKQELENRKKEMYERVNTVIGYAGQWRDGITVKNWQKELDETAQNLFDRTVNSIAKISKTDSPEWDMIDSLASDSDKKVKKIVEDDQKIKNYYLSEDFLKIRDTCSALTQSRREFNEYVTEKAESISKLFGTRVTRNETENEDSYNYVRMYKKDINPFTAEVSSTVFASAENDPIGYVVKYFYPDRARYPEQIEKLRFLVEELETLKDAKEIIENYKNDYNEYIKTVPDFILKNDEAGFYSRLGLAVIDENVLNVEYRFTYTSDGGKAQRSFTFPMNEENIAELITKLEGKLSASALVKEQRALMTAKLRKSIKQRDNYTCCQCGNSTYAEPNLLLEIDHIIPVARGGLTEESNLQTLCWKCNRSKGAKITV